MSAPLLATYRLQLRAELDFDAAAAITKYLAALGVSHLYSSPVLQAAPGSTHGYDVVDPHRVSEDLGGAEGMARLTAALRRHALGLVLDIVPNHMAIAAPANRWWWDVLENGPASRYARYFDVDWDPPEGKLRNQVLVPVLSDHYGRVLDRGGLAIERRGGRFVVRAGECVWPLAPRTLDELLAVAATRAGSDDLAAIADALGALPVATATAADASVRRDRGKEWLYRQLDRLCAAEPAVAAAIEAEVGEVNRDPGRLHLLLERQNYRLAFWRTAARELGYRRFFDIAGLVGLRAEEPDVFADTHALVARWLADGTVDGVRVDHPDGLRDPDAYFTRLREIGPEAWIVAEKILEPGERLPERWPIDGTTGYDFLHRAGGLFIDPDGAPALTELYHAFTGEPVDYAAVIRAAKQQVLRGGLAADVNRLTALLVEICERHPHQRDYTRHELHEAIREVIAAFPVYRTYLRVPGAVDPADAAAIEAAVEMAQQQRPDLDADLFAFLRDLLLLRVPGAVEQELAFRVQQFTGPAMAKGVEDCGFYVYNRFVAANEVGGDPGQLGVSVEAFHAACAATQRRWPRTLLATSTHDTKRSEDVRARLALLSEIPQAWADTVRAWSALAACHRRDARPDRNTEYLYYQTLVGAWPIATERLVGYMEKAVREAGVFTSWTRPDPTYEDAVRAFVAGTLDDAAFRGAVEDVVVRLVEPGRITSLAQVALKLTAPGIPDIYQGTEIWDASLVDPDNRRPVDYGARQRLLARLDGATAEDVWAAMNDGAPKLWLIRQGLAMRRAHAECFGAGGAYQPLVATGGRARHVVAFTRDARVATVVPRLLMGLAAAAGAPYTGRAPVPGHTAYAGYWWADTHVELPFGRWRNWLTAERVTGGLVPLAELLARFPIALLARE